MIELHYNLHTSWACFYWFLLVYYLHKIKFKTRYDSEEFLVRWIVTKMRCASLGVALLGPGVYQTYVAQVWLHHPH